MLLHLYYRLMATLETFVERVSKRLRPRRAGLAGARGLEMIEYVLMAGAVVIIIALFGKQLLAIFQNMLGKVSDGVNGKGVNS